MILLRRNNFKCVNKYFPNGLMCIRFIRQLLSYFRKYIILGRCSKRENRIIIIKMYNYLYNCNDLKINKEKENVCSLGSPAAVAAQSIVVHLLFIFCNIYNCGLALETHRVLFHFRLGHLCLSNLRVSFAANVILSLEFQFVLTLYSPVESKQYKK